MSSSLHFVMLETINNEWMDSWIFKELNMVIFLIFFLYLLTVILL